MKNKEKYLIAIENSIELLNKYKKLVKTRVELIKIKETQERLNSMYYEIKKG